MCSNDDMIDIADSGISTTVWDWFLTTDSSAPLPEAVPPELQSFMPGAEVILREWKPYRLHIPNATELLVNNEHLPFEFQPGNFTLTFENQLGLTTLTPVIDGVPQQPRIIEVIAGKFGSVRESVRFTDTVIQELAAHVSTLPFVVSASTARQIVRQHDEPNTFFAFHYLRHHAEELVRALQIITADPHRKLGDVVKDLRIHQARHIDAEALHSLLVGPRADVPRSGIGLSPLQRLQPLRIRQRRPEESWDTAENRFVVAFCHHLRRLVRKIETTWWFGQHATRYDLDRHDRLQRTIQHVLQSERFTGIPASLRLPAYSRVLQQRHGYRELMTFWNGLTQVHHPVLAELSRAVDLRDVPTLYEYWLFFEVANAIREYTGVTPRYPAVMDPYIRQQALWADFDEWGRLDTQASFGKADVYTGLSLRPDLVWTAANGRRVALDDKFAMTTIGELERDDDVPATQATSRDLVKMHAYRDAIDRLDAAFVLFPGTIGAFWPVDGEKRIVTRLDDMLGDIINATPSGIGAIPIKPMDGDTE